MMILQWLASIGSMVGNIGVIKKQWWGMLIWTIATILWIIYAINIKNYSQLTMFVFYEILNIIGLCKWIKDKRRKENENNQSII
jgi:nicotinamide riboside transporter PnuC